MIPQIGKKAPAIKLPNQNGTIRELKNYQGGWTVVYFYPKDDTSGCTKEACQIRDNFPAFRKLKVTVLGISVDSPESHKKFTDKYNLPFTLLSDEQKTVVKAYGVWQEKSMYGRKYMGTVRTSFLINPKGVISKVYEKVKPETHADEILRDLGELTKQ